MFDDLFLLLIHVQFPERSGDKSSAFSYMMILKCRLLSILYLPPNSTPPPLKQ